MLLDEAKDFKEATSSIVYDSLIKFPPTLPDSKSGRDFAKRLYLISTIEPNMESAMDNLIFMLLYHVGFSSGNWVIRYVFS